jgi:hypothetical protein
MPASLPPAKRKSPPTVFDAERTATGVPAENFQSRAGNEIVMRRKQIKSPLANCSRIGAEQFIGKWSDGQRAAGILPPTIVVGQCQLSSTKKPKAHQAFIF